MRHGKRPGAPRVCIALDLDCFYASVTIREKPHLASSPVGIVQKHLVVTTNYPARSLGVQKMTPVSAAKRTCPSLVLIDGSDLTPFRAASAEVMGVVRAWLAARFGVNGAAVACEKLGFDEIFIDLTDVVADELASGRAFPWTFRGHVFGEVADDNARRALMVASQMAADIRAIVTKDTSLTLCAGISNCKLLAKLAVNMHKPNDMTTFLPDTAPGYVAALPPRALPGFGHALERRIHVYGEQHGVVFQAASDISRYFGTTSARKKTFSALMGSDTVAKRILSLCLAVDDEPVKNSGMLPKSVSCEDSFRSCVVMADVRNRVTGLAQDLVRRLRADRVAASGDASRRPRTLTVRYRFRGQGFHATSRAMPMPVGLFVPSMNLSDPSCEEAAVSVIRRATLVSLSCAGVAQGLDFDLTLLAIGATNFECASDDAPIGDNGCSSIAKFLMKRSVPSQNPTSTPVSNLTNPVSDLTNSKGIPPLTNPAVRSHIGGSGTERTVLSCPICFMALPGRDNASLNKHIDNCLTEHAAPKANIPGQQPKRKKARLTAAKTLQVDSFFRKK